MKIQESQPCSARNKMKMNENEHINRRCFALLLRMTAENGKGNGIMFRFPKGGSDESADGGGFGDRGVNELVDVVTVSGKREPDR